MLAMKTFHTAETKYKQEHNPDPPRNPIERNHKGLHLENEVANC